MNRKRKTLIRRRRRKPKLKLLRFLVNQRIGEIGNFYARTSSFTDILTGKHIEVQK